MSKRKRPTRDTAAAKYRRAVERRNEALARLTYLTSTFFLSLNQKEPTGSGHKQTKSL